MRDPRDQQEQRDRRDRSARPASRNLAVLQAQRDCTVLPARDAEGYELLDAGDGERLERWGPYRLRRPDTRAVSMTRRLPASAWEAVDARYEGEAGHGAWKITPTIERDHGGQRGLPQRPERPARSDRVEEPAPREERSSPESPGLVEASGSREQRRVRSISEQGPAPAERSGIPERWTIVHEGVTLIVKLAPFKHTGVFPEQAAHWRWMREAAARAGRPLRVLNLFAYTGGATIALAKAGHIVTHVDASKPALAWARENARANDLPSDAIRWIQDDAATFVAREIRRGREYDAVLLDPPAFGRAPKNAPTPSGSRLWRLDEHLPDLIDAVLSLMPDPVFMLINDYARDADAARLGHLLHESLALRDSGVEAGHLSLETPDGRRLDTGVFARWTRSSASALRARAIAPAHE